MYRIKWLSSLLILSFIFSACGEQDVVYVGKTPDIHQEPVERVKRTFTFKEAIDHFTSIEAAIKENKTAFASELIDQLAISAPTSFPMEIDKPFLAHSFQDAVMKNARLIKNERTSSVHKNFLNLLQTLNGKNLFHNKITVPLDMRVARLVAEGSEPQLTTILKSDFSQFSDKELKERDAISMQSFWAKAFLYPSDAGANSVKETSAVVIKQDDVIVGILEFKNQLVKPKSIDLKSLADLYGVSKTEGYVSSVGRLAAFARLSIGEKMFEQFFKFAQANNISESYLHVRTDNTSAIGLYEKLGYQIVGRIPGYYPAPPSDAYVMYKKLS